MDRAKNADNQTGENEPLYKNNGAIDHMLNEPVSKVACDPIGRGSRDTNHGDAQSQRGTTGDATAPARTLAGMLALIVGAIVGG